MKILGVPIEIKENETLVTWSFVINGVKWEKTMPKSETGLVEKMITRARISIERYKNSK